MSTLTLSRFLLVTWPRPLTVWSNDNMIKVQNRAFYTNVDWMVNKFACVNVRAMCVSVRLYCPQESKWLFLKDKISFLRSPFLDVLLFLKLCIWTWWRILVFAFRTSGSKNKMRERSGGRVQERLSGLFRDLHWSLWYDVIGFFQNWNSRSLQNYPNFKR